MLKEIVNVKNYDYLRGSKRQNCEECGEKLKEKDKPHRYTICKKCRDHLFKVIDIMNSRHW